MLTLPIRVREVIAIDGSRVRSLHVFCPRQSESIRPERCARCNFRCPPEDGARAPAVGCSLEGDASARDCATPSILYGPEAAAARVPAGAASSQIIVCIQARAPLEVVRRAIAFERRWFAFPVVDEQGVLLGTVPNDAVGAACEHAAESLLPVSDAMLPAVAVRESDHLGDAISAMTSHHLRVLPIVDRDRRVMGILSDLDLLRWVARGAPAGWR